MSSLTNYSPIESALINNDLNRLSPDERLSYYKQICESVGLNPLTQPLAYLVLNGKLTLYAKRDATDQLRKVHKVSISITDRQKLDDIYVVTAKAKDATGREDEATGAVFIGGLKGVDLANAFLKCESKAKRRVTLSICGMGLLDETEVADIPREAKSAPFNPDPFEKAKQVETPKLDMTEILDAPKPGDFVAAFGKFNGKKLSDLDAFELNDYCQYINRKAKEDKKAITGKVLDFLNHAEAYLVTLEAKQ